MNALRVESVTMRAASADDQATGLVGFVNATINGLIIDGVTVRRSRQSELVLGFPMHRDRHGQTHAVVRPADDQVRREITRQVLAALGLKPTAVVARAPQGESP